MHQPKIHLLLPLLGALVLLAPACADDPVAHSETVSLKLSGIKNGDLQNGVASTSKNVNTESGNPYAVFLKNAHDALGGKDPSIIEPVSVYVRVSADSKNVIAIEQVLGDLELFAASSQTTIPIGHVTGPTGSSIRVPLDDTVDYEPLHDEMLSGDFKLGVRGNSVTPLPSDFELKLTLDVKFTAWP